MSEEANTLPDRLRERAKTLSVPYKVSDVYFLRRDQELMIEAAGLIELMGQALFICREVLTSPPVLNPEATLRIIDAAIEQGGRGNG